MVKIKVCGLRTSEHALAAAEAGADFVGMVFAESRRRVTLETAKEIAEAVRSLSEARLGAGRKRPALVGVFADQDAAEVNAIASAVGLDYVQLHGDEADDFCHAIERPVIRALRIRQEDTPSDVIAQLRRLETLGAASIYLLDTWAPDGYGGSGLAFDWHLAHEVARHFPILLAGGLSPDNVGEAVRRVRPWGIDVSSGVETNGVKDEGKIRAFVAAVRAAEREREAIHGR